MTLHREAMNLKRRISSFDFSLIFALQTSTYIVLHVPSVSFLICLFTIFKNNNQLLLLLMTFSLHDYEFVANTTSK